MSSSKTSFLRSASSLNGPKKRASILASDMRKARSRRRCLNWWRPECLPRTRRLFWSPTARGSMISYVVRFFRMPSAWTPDSWANAFSPTMALLRATVRPVTRLTRRLVGTRSSVRMPVRQPPYRSGRVARAMTISSSAALPARSPMPLIVTSTCRAPAWTAASVLATAMPRSSWQWTARTVRAMFGTCSNRCSIRRWNSAGVVQPTVSGMLTVVAPTSMTASTTWARKSGSVRAASSGENWTSRTAAFARRTPSTARRRISRRALCNLNSRWILLVARNTWTRGCRAGPTASIARSMSFATHRARPATVALRTSRLTARTASKSSCEVIGNPASMTSTPRRSRARATSSFSVRFMLAPGDCSPSRSVVSNTTTRLPVWPPMASSLGLRKTLL